MIGVIEYLDRFPNLYKNFQSILLVSPQCGMGPYWYKSRIPARASLGNMLSRFDGEAFSWPPLVSKRDRHDTL